jgi:hypothetical protein
LVLRKGSEFGADVAEAAYVGLSLLGKFERRREMANEYAISATARASDSMSMEPEVIFDRPKQHFHSHEPRRRDEPSKF